MPRPIDNSTCHTTEGAAENVAESVAEIGKNNPPGRQTYWRLLSYARVYWHFFLLSIIGFLLYSSSQPLLARMAGWLADTVYTREQSAVYLIPLSLLGIYLLRGIGSFLGNYYLSKVSFSVVKTLRDQMFSHLLLLPNRFYEQHNSGHLISMITYNVEQVAQAITDAIRTIVREGITVIALLGYIFYLNWKLTLAFLLIAPVIAFIVAFVSKKFKQLSRNIQVSMGDLTHVSAEAINGYLEVKSYGGQNYEQQRFARASHNNYLQNMRMIITASINTPVLQMIVAMSLAALIFVALSFMHKMQPDDFIAYITAAGLLPKPIRQLSDVNIMIQKGIAAAESIFALLDTPTEQQSSETTDILMTVKAGKHLSESEKTVHLQKQMHIDKRVNKVITGYIRFQEVCFGYQPDKLVINHFNLDIEPGQTIALVGRSGSGKTTLTHLLPRFYSLDSGRILLDGMDINQYDPAFLRANIALVSQQVTLFNDTIEKNIAYGELATKSRTEIEAAARAAHAMEFIHNLAHGMDTVIGENGVLLSGGQRQRLAIARALLKDAPILILDEATSALDNESEKLIQQALRTVIHNRTTLIIAHRLSTIIHADKIVVMAQGKVVECGTHQELLARKRDYYQLYQMQFAHK